jgi:hypothetical protein
MRTGKATSPLALTSSSDRETDLLIDGMAEILHSAHINFKAGSAQLRSSRRCHVWCHHIIVRPPAVGACPGCRGVKSWSASVVLQGVGRVVTVCACHAPRVTVTRDSHARRVSAQGRGGGARTRGSNAQARLHAISEDTRVRASIRRRAYRDRKTGVLRAAGESFRSLVSCGRGR